MRRLIVLLFAAGCASAAPPPGGPPDEIPPQVVEVSPDSGATNVRARSVVFRFDDVVSDRISRGSLAQFFLISPREGAVRVSWHRREIEVRPRRGFRPNTAYTVTKLPGLADLEGNRDTTTLTVLFATGPRIPSFGIVGRLFDWGAERPVAGAIVEAVRRPDSLVYLAVTDTSGGFVLGPFDAGTYTVRGYVDQNNNFALDRGEKWDSTQVTITTTRPFVNLLAVVRDTIPPSMSQVTEQDSVTIQVTFDRALDPAQPFTPVMFRVLASDSTPLRILDVATDSEIRAAEDSVVRAREDSVRRADSLRAAAAGRPPAPGAGGRVTTEPPRPPRQPPPTSVELRLSPTTPLRRATSYRITAFNVQAIGGKAGTSTRVFQTRRAADTLRTPPARPPAARPPAARPPATRPPR